MPAKTQKILSCGIVPIKIIHDEWHFLILRCFRYWDFPKGHLEDGEDPWQAALRELQEETALTEVECKWGQDFAETEIYGQGKVARYYLAHVTSEQDVELLPNPESGLIEHHEFRWVRYAEAHSMLVPRVQRILDWAQKLIA